MKEKIKKYWLWVAIITYVIWLSWQDSNPFWIILLILGIGTYLVLTKPIAKKINRIILTIIWASFFIVFGLGIYVNYYLPHGPSYPTGEIVCQNDDRGLCKEQYIEDMRGLSIPDWAKFLRKSEGVLLCLSLLFVGIAISSKKDENYNENNL
ncbi:MAG: hypothetical protein ABIH10_00935 [Spirochaetota bacterium]